MKDESEVRLVVSHSRDVRCHENLDPIVQKLIFEVLPIGIAVRKAVMRDSSLVGGSCDPLACSPFGDLLRVSSRENVDDPCSGKIGHESGEPGQARRLISER